MRDTFPGTGKHWMANRPGLCLHRAFCLVGRHQKLWGKKPLWVVRSSMTGAFTLARIV